MAILELVRPLRSSLGGEPGVRLALVQAAVPASIDCAAAESLLLEAAEWRQVESSAQKDELNARLDEIPSKCPQIVEPLRVLRQ